MSVWFTPRHTRMPTLRWCLIIFRFWCHACRAIWCCHYDDYFLSMPLSMFAWWCRCADCRWWWWCFWWCRHVARSLTRMLDDASFMRCWWCSFWLTMLIWWRRCIFARYSPPDADARWYRPRYWCCCLLFDADYRLLFWCCRYALTPLLFSLFCCWCLLIAYDARRYARDDARWCHHFFADVTSSIILIIYVSMFLLLFDADDDDDITFTAWWCRLFVMPRLILIFFFF